MSVRDAVIVSTARSPIGRAFLGLAAGDEADATTPGGSVRVKVVAIH